MDANFQCYFCEASFHTNRHRCTRECRLEGEKVRHFGFCQKCKNILVRGFENQLRRRQLPAFNPPRVP